MLANDCSEKLRSVWQRPDAEVPGNRLAEIGKGLARTEIDAAAYARPRQQHRYVLARMVRAGRRRIVAVVGGDDEQIGVAEVPQHAAQLLVAALEIRRVSGDVVPVTVLRVRVHE